MIHPFQRVLWTALVAVAALAPSQGVFASDHLTATSTTALSITGSVVLTPTSLIFANGQTLSLSPPTSVAQFSVDGTPREAQVFAVASPANPVLKNKNRLCGSDRSAVLATYIVMWHPDPLGSDVAPRTLAVFSGATPPTSTSDASLCDIFEYEAAPLSKGASK